MTSTESVTRNKRLRNKKIPGYELSVIVLALMAELADALHSGCSRSNPVSVQITLRAPIRFYIIKNGLAHGFGEMVQTIAVKQ